jgi:hypothetical protein
VIIKIWSEQGVEEYWSRLEKASLKSRVYREDGGRTETSN